MRNIFIILIVLVFSCSKTDEKPQPFLPHVMEPAQLIDRGKLDLLNVLTEDTTITVYIKGVVETDSSLSLVSIFKPEHEKYQKQIKEYLKTVKFIPAHYVKDNKAFRQEVGWSIKLHKK